MTKEKPSGGGNSAIPNVLKVVDDVSIGDNKNETCHTERQRSISINSINHAILRFTQNDVTSCPPLAGGPKSLISRRGSKAAFTLAEVLITLGIIGVVAAMTMPTLIQGHKKQVTETKLKKFYSVVNQAILLESAEQGDPNDWSPSCSSNDQRCLVDWWNTHIQSHIKTIKNSPTNGSRFDVNWIIYTDGTAMMPFINGDAIHISFCINTEHCDAKNITESNGSTWHQVPFDGKYSFLFTYYPETGKMLSDYQSYHELTTAQLVDECKKTENGTKNAGGCTTLIMRNGWNIPKDYPIRF